MRKTLLATMPVAAFIAGMAIVPSVFAAGETYNTWDELKTCLEGQATTCVLGQDISEGITEYVTVGQDVTLDLAGHNMTLGDGFYFWVKGGNDLSIVNTSTTPSTITRDRASNNYATIYVYGNTAENPTTLNIGKNVTVQGINSQVSIDKVGDGNAAQNVSKVTIDGALNSTSVSDGSLCSGLNINGIIKGGPEVKVTGSITGLHAGIYQAGDAVININGGTVTGTEGSGIIIKSGKLTLQNATILGQGEDTSIETSNIGAKPTGAGLQIESNTPPYEGNVDITIGTGTSITSEKGYALQTYGTTENGIEKVAIEGNDIQLTSATGKPVLDNQAEDTGFKGVTNALGEVLDLGTTTYEIPAPTPETPETPAETPAETPENPDTADSIALYATVATLALLGLGATAFFAKKFSR